MKILDNFYQKMKRFISPFYNRWEIVGEKIRELENETLEIHQNVAKPL
jgi:hypothetical protein